MGSHKVARIHMFHVTMCFHYIEWGWHRKLQCIKSINFYRFLTSFLQKSKILLIQTTRNADRLNIRISMSLNKYRNNSPKCMKANLQRTMHAFFCYFLFSATHSCITSMWFSWLTASLKRPSIVLRSLVFEVIIDLVFQMTKYLHFHLFMKVIW